MLAPHAQRDNVIIALPFSYTDDQLASGLYSASAAMILSLCCLLVNAIGFFFGFSTFDISMSIFRACRPIPCRSCGLAC